METRAVIFDMDGVLVDSNAHHRGAWRALLDELGVAPAPPEFWRLTIGRPSTEAVPLLLGRVVDVAEAHRLADRKLEHYRRLSRSGLLAVRGVSAFIDELATQCVPCAVATSATRMDTDQLLGRLGLLERFAAVITAEDVRRGKPDPEVYLRAASAIGIEPRDCLVFEDAIVGVQAARRASMRVIGVTTAHSETELRAAGVERVVEDFEGVTWPA